jgi:signal transduction histidine kinase
MATRFRVYPTLLYLLLTGSYSFGQDGSLLALPPTIEQVVVRKPFLLQFADPKRPRSLSAIRQLPVNQWQAVNSVNFGDLGSPGWVTFQLSSPVERTVWLELESHFIDSVQVWLIQEPGSPNETILTYQPTGFRTLTNDRDAPTQHPFFLKPLHLLPNVRYAVYIRGWVPPGDTLKFEVNLWSPVAFFGYQQRLVVGWAVFVGLVLMSVFITLVSYAFHPQRIYLYYCGYVLCMSIYALLNDGWGMFLPDPLRWFDSSSRVVHWISFGILFLMLFSRSFLAVNKKVGWWLRLNPIWLELLLEVAIFIADYGVHHNRFDWVMAGYRIGFGTIALYALLWFSYVADAIRRRFLPVWLYVGSMQVWLFFFAMDIWVVNTGWMTEPFPDMLVFRVAILAEVGLLFIGWMYRQRIIRESAQRLAQQEQARRQELFETEQKRQAEELKALRLQTELQQQRERLARDLHDGIGSQLTHIAGRLDILSVRATNERPQLQRLSHFTRETNQALRDTVWILNRSEIHLSTFAGRLNTYLQYLWEDIQSPQLTWRTDPSTTDPVLPPLVVQGLFRITQEAVNNALKYASATTIDVSLLLREDTLQLIVTDNGIGFDTTTTATGYGLTNMRKRTEEIGGEWTLTSNGSGTTVHVKINISR